MGKTKDLGHLAHIVTYDAENHITVPAGITMHTNQLVASQAWVTTALGSYALSSSLGSYVPTSRTITINGTTYDLSANREWNITSMIYPAAGIPLSTGSAWGTSITNNSDNWNTAYGWGNHATAGYLTGITSTQVTTALGFTPVANTRTITINGTTYDLSADRSWTITASGGVTSFNTRTGAITLSSSDVTGALGYTPYNNTNPSSYITSSGTAAAINQTVGAGSEANLVYSQIADNDFFRIRVGGASNAGWVEIATADDGTEPIYVRQYTGVFSSLTRTATLLDGSGNTSFPGTVSSPTFRLSNSSNNAYFTGNSDWGVRLVNDNGYIQFGPANNSWTHIYTDKSFYFNQNLYVNGTQVVTNSGTWSISISGNAATAGTASNSNTVSGISASQFFNNMGQTHGTYTNFNSYGDWGFRYMQGSSNGPGTGASQYYGMTLGLGNEYSNYGTQLYWNRTSTGGNPYLSVRYLEGGSWGSWSKIYAGYADSSGNADTTDGYHLNQNVTTSGSPSFSNVYAGDVYTTGGWFRNHTNNSGIYWSNTGWHLYPKNSSDFYLHSGTSDASIQFQRGGTNANYIHNASDNAIGFLSTGRGWILRVDNSGNTTASGDVTAYSDIRLKENIVPLTNALEKVLKLQGVFYNRIDIEDKSTKIGFIAQHVKEVVPEVVHINEDALAKLKDRHSIDYGKLTALLTEAIKEQQIKIDNQDKIIEELKRIINGLTK